MINLICNFYIANPNNFTTILLYKIIKVFLLSIDAPEDLQIHSNKRTTILELYHGNYSRCC